MPNYSQMFIKMPLIRLICWCLTTNSSVNLLIFWSVFYIILTIFGIISLILRIIKSFRRIFLSILSHWAVSGWDWLRKCCVFRQNLDNFLMFISNFLMFMHRNFINGCGFLCVFKQFLDEFMCVWKIWDAKSKFWVKFPWFLWMVSSKISMISYNFNQNLYNLLMNKSR